MAMLTTSLLKPICQKCNRRLLALTALVIYCAPSLAVDPSQLWLPREYYRHLAALHKAVDVAENTERCAYVIAGTLSQNRSTKEHPVFALTCRDKDKHTFAWIIDGLSLQILNLPPPLEPELLAAQEQQKALEVKWMACNDQLVRRAKGLRGVTWQTRDMPEPEKIEQDAFRFTVDFSAVAPSGSTLRYRALCDFAGDTKSVNIHPRAALEPLPEGDLDVEQTEPGVEQAEPSAEQAEPGAEQTDPDAEQAERDAQEIEPAFEQIETAAKA